MNRLLTGLSVAALCVACTAPTEPGAAIKSDWRSSPGYADALSAIDGSDLSSHVRVLAADDFGGRAPFSEGERKTVAYLEDAFKKLGLQPGSGDSYRQAVELVSIAADPDVSMTIAAGDTSRQLAYGNDMIVWTKRVVEQSSLQDSPLVFVGYGIVAPQYDWNDYAGIDMTGKTAVILVNDPGYATQNPDLFNGNAMTYYGRWTYKYEEAARQGAAGAIVIHETGAAGYPWEVVSGSWSGPGFDLAAPDNNLGRANVEGWVTQAAAKRLFADTGLDYDALLATAATGELTPTPISANVSVALSNTIKRSKSFNVAAVIPGSDTPDEYFIYMAHWDHLGTAAGMDGDNIHNGAVDNATGTAGLIELGQAFMALPEAPKRSIMLLAVTAEESGLLGSAFYGSNPLVPLNKTVGGVNTDSMNVLGRTKDVVVVGKGSSQLEDYLEEEANAQDRVVVREPTPEKGFFYRSDHFNFAKRGVPVLYAESGVDYLGKGREWGLAQQADYTAHRYHKPGDEFDPNWDWSGAVEDLQLMFTIGYRVANDGSWPNWYEGNEFRAIRDASLAVP